MGCSRGNSQCYAYEKPAHLVNAVPYTEVIVDKFDQINTDTGYVADAERDAGGNVGCLVETDNGGIGRSCARSAWEDDKTWRTHDYQQSTIHPVICISWNDINKYANWFAAQTGRDYF